MAQDPPQTPLRAPVAPGSAPSAGIFEDDEQIVELHPEFWEQHKLKIVAGVVATLAGAIGFGWWQANQVSVARDAAAAFAAASTVSEFERVARDFPSSPVAAEALLMAADIERQGGKPAEAAAFLERFLTQHKTHLLAGGALHALAIIREEQGQADQAAGLFRQLLVEHPQSYAAPMASLNLARLLEAQGQSAEAEGILQRFGASHTGSIFIQNAELQLQLRNAARTAEAKSSLPGEQAAESPPDPSVP